MTGAVHEGASSDTPEFSVFSAFLKRRGLKLTEQRRHVLARALAEPKHFSAEQLLTNIKRQDSSISKATVYRTLALLVESHLLDSVDFERGHMLYERALGHMHHDHLICTECGRIVEFHDEAIEKAQQAVAQHHKFEVAWHTHKLYGLCASCKKKGVTPEGAVSSRPRAR
jgi:Fur family ferric uptake transcriptional regulator